MQPPTLRSVSAKRGRGVSVRCQSRVCTCAKKTGAEGGWVWVWVGSMGATPTWPKYTTLELATRLAAPVHPCIVPQTTRVGGGGGVRPWCGKATPPKHEDAPRTRGVHRFHQARVVVEQNRTTRFFSDHTCVFSFARSSSCSAGVR